MFPRWFVTLACLNVIDETAFSRFVGTSTELKSAWKPEERSCFWIWKIFTRVSTMHLIRLIFCTPIRTSFLFIFLWNYFWHLVIVGCAVNSNSWYFILRNILSSFNSILVLREVWRRAVCRSWTWYSESQMPCSPVVQVSPQ